MFSQGDAVVYRHHVCEVAALREGCFEGKDYLELHTLFEHDLKLFVAAADAVPPLVRPAMTRREALALIDALPDISAVDDEALHAKGGTFSLAERQVKEEYDRYLKTGDARDFVKERLGA